MKALIRVGYDQYVMDIDRAITLLESLADAEVFQEKYDSETKTHSVYVYAQESKERVRELRLISDDLYKMAKLAGKPN